MERWSSVMIRSNERRLVTVLIGCIACIALLYADGRQTALAQSESMTKKRTAAKAHVKQAVYHHKNKNYLLAVEEYKKAHLQVEKPINLFNIAQAYRLAGDLEFALEFYNRYLKVAPQGKPRKFAQKQVTLLTKLLAHGRKQSVLTRGQAGKAQKQAADANREASAAKKRVAALQELLKQAREDAEQARKDAEQARKQSNKAHEKADAAIQRANEANSSLAVSSLPMEKSRIKAQALRYTGIGMGAVGLTVLLVGGKYGWDASQISDQLDNASWSREVDIRVRKGEAAERNMYVCYGIGALALVAGGAFYFFGHWTRPTESTSQLTVLPTTEGRGASVTLRGEF